LRQCAFSIIKTGYTIVINQDKNICIFGTVFELNFIYIINPSAMKHIHLLLVLFFTLLIISSCRKQPVSPSGSQNIENLIANESFDWETTQDVEFKISTPFSNVIVITSENGIIIYHKGYYNSIDPTYNVKINLPKYIDKVLINGKITEVTGDIVDVKLFSDKTITKSKRIIPTTGRIAYWEFNENSGNTISDSQSNNNGVMTGADWVSGIDGSALDFDGTGGHVEIPTTDELNFEGENASFSVWFKMNELGENGTLLFNRMKYILKLDNHGKVSLGLYNPTWSSVTTDWSDRVIDTDWHNVVVTYDGAHLHMYIDAVLIKTTETTGEINLSTSDVFIGNQETQNDFAGIIDQVAIYTSTLTPTEITELYQNTPNPGTGNQDFISHWKLNSNSGSTAIDSESTNNGTITGAQWVTGVEGSALEFNGNSNYVSIPNASNLNLTQEITIMAWAKTRENKTAKIAQKGDWDGHGIYQDNWNGWKCGIRMETNTSHSINWGDGIPMFDEWYLITMTYDGTNLKLFVNGQLKNSKSVSGNLKINNRVFSIGSDNGSQKFFNGSIDDVRIYGKALSQAEIQFIFNNAGNTGNTDTDGDGIQDNEDEYPNDPARAFNNFLPAAGYGSLAFEDLWPGRGDYDFNDLILDYRFTTVTNAQNKVAEIRGSFVVRAIGAGLRNGFGFQFPNNNIDANDIFVDGYRIEDGYISLNANGIEENQNKPTIIVFDNANNILQSTGGFGVNVEPGVPYVEPDTILISMIITPNIYMAEDFNLINFNPFLIIDEIRGKEVHLANYPPTNLADVSYFGTMDDDSNPATGKYYKTENNLPWAIKISESYDYTIEKVEITQAYLKFYEWAASSGSSYQNWYQNEAGFRDNAKIYVVP